MSDLFDIIRLYSLPTDEKIRLIHNRQYLEYFVDDTNLIVSECATLHVRRARIRNINNMLKEQGLGGI